MRLRTAAIGFGLSALLVAQVRYEDIRKSPGNDWLTYAGDYQGTRHSPLTQINRDNAGSLVPKWEDRVVGGVWGGDSGMRGFVASYSAATGEELWRFYTIPAKGEPGSESWGDFAVEWGGGATWLSGTFDPDLNLLYWTTGNPWPDFYGGGRRGDNLYSWSVVALDLETGKLKWHLQFTPHETHHWDAGAWAVLVELPLYGRPRQLLMHA